MATIRAVYNRTKDLDVLKESMAVLTDTSSELLGLNKRQLQFGDTRQGQRFKKYASQEYAQDKNQRNPIPGLGNPDLKDTGAFYKAFKFKVLSREKYEIFSTDSKAAKLEKKYGKESIYGMNDESQEYFVRNTFRGQLMKRIKEITKL